MHFCSVWHSSGGDTCHLPRELWHKTDTRSRIISPPIVSVSNHRLAPRTKVSAWERKGAGLVAVKEEGWGSWVKGRKGVKSHLELYAFPSLSAIQINWIYAAIVWLKPRTPGGSPLPHRNSVTLKAKTLPFYLSRPYKPNSTAAQYAHGWCYSELNNV